MDNVKNASIDESTMIILTQEGDVFTCGWNESGQLGTGDTEDRNIPEWVYNILILRILKIGILFPIMLHWTSENEFSNFRAVC